MLQILQILSHPFCMQNKQAYTPEVVRCIIWANIVDTGPFLTIKSWQMTSSSRATIFNSQCLRWKGITCLSSMGSRFRDTIFRQNGCRRSLRPGDLCITREKWGGYLSTPSWCPSWLYQPVDTASNAGQAATHAIQLAAYNVCGRAPPTNLSNDGTPLDKILGTMLGQ
jgi:hypothetical protein